MKAASLVFNGKRYLVNAQSVVAEQAPDVELGFGTKIRFCDSTESAQVIAEVKRLRHNKARRERDALMRGMGLIKVRGNMGGTYWE